MQTQFIRSAELLRENIKPDAGYPFDLPAIRFLQKLELHPKVTFFVGENGSGKSTLLEAMAVNYGLNAEGGSKNFNFATQESHSELHKHLRLSKGITQPKDSYFLRAESFYNVASNIDQMDEDEGAGPPIKTYYGGTSLHEQSHGESFFALFMNRLYGNGMYFLDEPEAALSPQKQMTLLVRMHELIGKNSQFIIATHSPLLLSYPNAEIFLLTENGYEKTEYQQTDHYRLYKAFLDDPTAMLRKLNIN